jgi:protein-tyrosine phosphatase
LIDLHFHCLPGIDDGPESWDEAVELCRLAASEGTTHIVATPHVLRERWVNDNAGERDELLLKLNTLLGGAPALLPGCEYFFSSDALELWELGASGPLYGLNRGSYLLIEFPAPLVPPSAERIFHEFSLIGVTPVIAHPERNLTLARDPDFLARLVGLGAITQLTAASMTGEWGENVQAVSAEFLDRGLVHTVASDAHSVDRRPPRLQAAYEWLQREAGIATADAIMLDNPKAIIANEPIPFRPDL